MFRELMNLWKKGGLLSEAFDDANEMLARVSEIFVAMTDWLVDGKTSELDAHKQDKQINVMEQEIRRKVLKHLSVNPQQEVAASLTLTNVVIDIERIGDYSKNIEELVELYHKNFQDVQYMPLLRELTRFVQQMFDEVRASFKDGDEQRAREAIANHKKVRRGCNKILEQAFSTTETEVPQAVVSVLYARYLKRVSAHLKNIATSVVNPFDTLGYSKNT